MPSTIAILERTPLSYVEEADYLFVDLHVFQVRFRKGTAGYDEIWKNGEQIVAEVRWFLQDSKGKQMGEPRRIEWEIIDEFTLRVTRFYTDFEGTDFQVIQECRSDNRIKVSVEGVFGKSDTFSLVWSASGIVSPSVTHEEQAKRVSCFESDILEPQVAFDYLDVYEQSGDITLVEISGSAGGRKVDFVFSIGDFSSGQTFSVDPSTIGTSTSAHAIRFSYQRRCFYAFGRFWVFYSNGTDLVYRTSTDGAVWSGETVVKAAVTYGTYFTAWFDGTYLHYAYGSAVVADPILYRRGTPNADGSVSWSAAEQTAVAGVVGETYYYPSVSVDSEGYIWIGYLRHDGVNVYPYATISGNNDGTWGTTPGGFPYQVSVAANVGWRVTVVPLTNRKVLTVYARAFGKVHARRWNGAAWGAEKDSATSIFDGNDFSAVAEPDDVHIAFFPAGTPPLNILYTKYTYATDSFGAETSLEAAALPTLAPVISIDGDNYLYVFYAGFPTADHIFYRRWNGAAWDARVDWVDETALDLTDNGFITGHYGAYSGYIALVWLATSDSPYDVRHKFLSGLTPFTPVTKYPAPPGGGGAGEIGVKSLILELLLEGVI